MSTQPCIPKLLQVRSKRRWNLVRELHVTEPEVVEGYQVSEAPGNAPSRAIPTQGNIPEVRQCADVQRNRARELVVGEVDVV